MRLRFLIISAIFLMLNGYVALHVLHHWPVARQHQYLVWLVTAIFAALQLTPFFSHIFLFQKNEQQANKILAAVQNWVPYLVFGIFSCLIVYTFAEQIISLVWQLVSPPDDPEQFGFNLLIALGVVTLSTVTVGVWQAISGPKIVKIDVPLNGLPPNFDGFKIAQISDLHAGATIGNGYVEKVVQMVNGLQADLIVLTGDIMEGKVEDLQAELRTLSKLQAPFGRYLITGNHEYYWGIQGWIDAFKKTCLKVLLNEHVTLNQEDQELILAGVTDYSTMHLSSDHACNPAQALQNVASDKVKILLAHQPVTYRLAQEGGADLMLSGHTHGGQYFPFNLFIGLFQKYATGLNRYKNMLIYVNKGTGYWGPPLRTFVPSEITLLTLRKK